MTFTRRERRLTSAVGRLSEAVLKKFRWSPWRGRVEVSTSVSTYHGWQEQGGGFHEDFSAYSQHNSQSDVKFVFCCIGSGTRQRARGGGSRGSEKRRQCHDFRFPPR